MKNSNFVLTAIVTSLLSACSKPTIMPSNGLALYAPKSSSGSLEYTTSLASSWQKGFSKSFTVTGATLADKLLDITTNITQIRGSFTPTSQEAQSDQEAFIYMKNGISCNTLNVTQSATNNSALNIQGLILADTGNTVAIAGAAVTTMNIGNIVAPSGGNFNISGGTTTLDTLDATDLAISVSNGGNLIFGGGGSQLNGRPNADYDFTSLRLQYGELKGTTSIVSSGSDVTIANGNTLVINSTAPSAITTPTLRNNGTLTITQGVITGNITNNAGGNFIYDNTANATITGAFNSTGAGNIISLTTGSNSLMVGSLTTDANTVINVYLKNAGASSSAGVSPAVDAIPVIRTTGSVSLNGVKVNVYGKNANAIGTGTTYTIIGGASAPTGTLGAVRLDPATIKNASAATPAAADVTVAVSGTNLVLTVVNGVIAAQASGAVGLGSFSGFSRSQMAGSFMSKISSGFSSDYNANISKFGELTLTSSYEETSMGKSNFMGVNFKLNSNDSLLSYLNYDKDKTVNEFGIFSLNKVGGVDVLSGVSYGAKMDDSVEDLSLNTKTLLAGTTLSKSFDVGDVKITPNVFVGFGQMIENKTFYQNACVDMDFTAAIGSLGFDIVRSFKVDTTTFQAFARFNHSSELTQRYVTHVGEKEAFDGRNTSLMLGFKAQTDQNSSLYATTQFEKQGTADINSKFAFGVNVKF